MGHEAGRLVQIGPFLKAERNFSDENGGVVTPYLGNS